MSRLLQVLRRDGWVVLLLLLCVICCLLSSGTGGNQASGDEARLNAILSAMEGAGRVRTSVFTDSDGAATGMVIMASGAEDITVELRLRRAAMTLLQLDADRIAVYKLKED